ncbi:MAG: hypothetical protein IPJ42_15755 [Betaproteobacteria bacterium]|nr:hypothetical protein [Betaproteobacteria bacterium]
MTAPAELPPRTLNKIAAFSVAAPPTRHAPEQMVANARNVLQPSAAMLQFVRFISTAWAQDANVLTGSATKVNV